MNNYFFKSVYLNIDDPDDLNKQNSTSASCGDSRQFVWYLNGVPSFLQHSNEIESLGIVFFTDTWNAKHVLIL